MPFLNYSHDAEVSIQIQIHPTRNPQSQIRNLQSFGGGV